MENVIIMREWIIRRIESGKPLSPNKLDKLYQHYQRIRMFESEDGGERICPQRT